jgi:hypothetical protein
MGLNKTTQKAQTQQKKVAQEKIKSDVLMQMSFNE